MSNFNYQCVQDLDHVKLGLCFLVSALLAVPGCELLEVGNESPEAEQSSVLLIPNEVWVSDAEAMASNESSTLISCYYVHADLSGVESEIELRFSPEKRLVELQSTYEDSVNHNLFFEDGRLVFSAHQNSNSKEKFIMAYANDWPYAAAVGSDGHYNAIEPYKVPMNLNWLRSATARALELARMEQGKPSNRRLIQNQNLIESTIHRGTREEYVVNLRKGQWIDIQVQSPENSTFFTISPSDNTNLDYDKWSGMAKKTGDLTITVFSVSEDLKSPFTLNVNVREPQSLNSAQAKQAA